MRGWRKHGASASCLATTRRVAYAACLVAALTLPGPGAITGPLLPVVSAQGASPLDLQRNPSNWATVLGNYQGWRYSPLNQITVGNANRLTVAWTFSTGVLRGHEGSPLVVGSTMYPESCAI